VDEKQRLIIAELGERVEQIFAALETLRDNLGDGRARREAIDLTFRQVHSLKAAAAISGCDNVASLAHQVEGLLRSLRVGHLEFDPETLTLLEDTAAALGTSVANPYATPSPELSERLQQFVDLETHSLQPPSPSAYDSLPEELLNSLNSEEKHRLLESIAEGASLYLVEASFSSADFDQHFQRLREHLAESGDVISTSPTIDEQQADSIKFKVLYTRAAVLDQVTQELASSPVLVTALFDPGGNSALADSSTKQPALRTIPIRLDDLDRVISRTHKLFRDTTKFLGHATSAGSPIEGLYAGLVELAADLVHLRMVPIDRVLYRAVRSGRNAARASGKEVDFSLRGQDLLLDKSLCETIADPLIHLVRNAVDHGIENPEERLWRGKNKKGQVHIEASALQGQTRITVTDDGRGIDPEVVSAAARKLQIIDREIVLPLAQSLRLIFRPSFSTAAEGGAISGRGVGLDVVETAVEEAGGDVRVSSMPAVGSSFEIRLPVTFALLEVWVVTVGDQRYLIDSAQVQDKVTVSAEVVAAKETFPVGPEALPLLHLANLLEQRSSLTTSGEVDVLVCRVIKDQGDDDGYGNGVGIMADSVAGTEKVLLRNLGSRGGRWFGVTGAAELRDGGVALMLDLARLVAQHNKEIIRG